MPAPGTLATILKIGTDVSQMVTGFNQGLEIINKFGSVVQGVMNTVVSAAQSGIHALQNVARSIMSLTGESARLDSMRDSFNKMSAEFGETGQSLLAAMREATLGMTKDADLIQSSMTAMMLISKEAMGDASETIPMFAQIATSAARALGEDVSFMFQSLVRGIGRASPMILDNLGFTIRLGEVYGAYAEQLGKTAKELTTVERQQALINVVMEQGVGYVEKLGISTGGLATVQKQLRTEIQNLKDTIGQAFMPLVQALQGMWSQLATTIISKVIPAFRTLGRVFSEVFGVKNPFMRWIQGDPAGETAKRIGALKDSLADLKEMGPNFAGGITDAVNTFNEEMSKLAEKFGPQLAEIQSELAEKIQNIWDDFNLQQARRDEDYKEEERRRTQDHYEQLEEMRRRFDEDISDAIRKRDARALLNLLRRQKQETSEKQQEFDKETKRREADREKELRRAKEDAERRVTDAAEAAAKQAAAVQEQWEKAAAELEAERDKAIAAAQSAWEAEIAAMEDAIQKQQELLIEQIQEEAKLRAEMEKPLSPFWQKFKDMLEVVWEKLQKVRDIILSIIEDPSAANILEQLGLSPELVETISTKFNEFKEWLAEARDKARELWEQIVKIAGPEFVAMWEDLKRTLDVLKPYWPDILIVLKALATIIKTVVIAALITFLGILRGVANAIPILAVAFGKLAEGLRKFWKGLIGTIEGSLKIIVGLFTGNMKLVSEGWKQWWENIKKYTGGILEVIMAIFSGALATVLGFFEGFFTSVVDVFKRLSNTLIGRSIIPDMLDAIQRSISNFLSTLFQTWSQGWQKLSGVVQDVWAWIQQIVQTASTGISNLIGTWAGGLRDRLSTIFSPVQNLFSGLQGGVMAGATGGMAAGAQNMNVNANNWNIYGQGPGGGVGEVFNAVRDVVSGAMADWTRRR